MAAVVELLHSVLVSLCVCTCSRVDIAHASHVHVDWCSGIERWIMVMVIQWKLIYWLLISKPQICNILSSKLNWVHTVTGKTVHSFVSSLQGKDNCILDIVTWHAMTDLLYVQNKAVLSSKVTSWQFLVSWSYCIRSIRSQNLASFTYAVGMWCRTLCVYVFG